MIYRRLIIIFFLIPYFCQSQNDKLIYLPNGGILEARGQFYEDEPQQTNCLTEKERNQIQNEINQNLDKLYRNGIIERANPSQKPLFKWPLKQKDGLNDYGNYSISQNVDQQSGSGIKDYNCGTLAYDGHKGLDLRIRPYEWLKLANNEVEIVAAAPGVISKKTDGKFSKNCDWDNNNGGWNAVYVRHDDGSIAWYGHLKKGTLTSKRVGDKVKVGEYLGVAGSSGRSSTPHLHLEVYNSNNKLIDPWKGQCNSKNSDSWWEKQPPYVDAGINRISTNFAVPEFPNCSNGEMHQIEKPNERTKFNKDEKIYLIIHFRHISKNDEAKYIVYQPDGTEWKSWDWKHTGSFSKNPWRSQWFMPGNEAPDGKWKFVVEYKNKKYEHDFTVGDITTSIIEEDKLDFNIYPNPANDKINIQFNSISHSNYSIELRDILGKIIVGRTNLDRNNNFISLPIYDLRNGTYFVHVKNKNSKKVKIIVKH